MTTDTADHPARDEIWEFYWRSDIPLSEIAETYGIEKREDLYKIAGPAFFDAHVCYGCGVPIAVTSRTRRDEIRDCGREARWCCKPCAALENERVRQEWRREDELRQARRRELATMPYGQYLQTPEWQETRRIALKRSGYRCQVCFGGGALDVHHRTYQRRGNEYASDVIVLCRDCHQLFHDNGKITRAAS